MSGTACVERLPERLRGLPRPGALLRLLGGKGPELNSFAIVAGKPYRDSNGWWMLPTFWGSSGRIEVSLAVGHWYTKGKGFNWEVIVP